jgi:Outer membrane protein beta-barrel domain
MRVIRRRPVGHPVGRASRGRFGDPAMEDIRLNWQAVFLSINQLTRPGGGPIEPVIPAPAGYRFHRYGLIGISLNETSQQRGRRMDMIRMWRSAFIGGGLLAAVSAGVGAAGFNYSYAEVGFTSLNSDPLDAKGGTAELSLAAGDYMHVKGGYSHFNNADLYRKVAFPFSGKNKLSVDIDSFSIGLGGNYPAFRKVDLTGTLSYLDNEFSGDSSNSDRGYELEAGARVQAMKKLELTPSLVKVNIDNYDATGYSLGLVYALNKQFSLRTRVRKFGDDDVTDVFAGVRLNF